MPFEVSFPGRVAVDVTFRGHTIRTDQPAPLGEDAAMSPSDLLFAAMASCMGFYALRFCQQRELSTEGLGLTLSTTRDEAAKRTSHVSVELRLPEGFPEKYREAIVRAVNECSVKKTIMNPPEFSVDVVQPVPGT